MGGLKTARSGGKAVNGEVSMKEYIAIFLIVFLCGCSCYKKVQPCDGLLRLKAHQLYELRITGTPDSIEYDMYRKNDLRDLLKQFYKR